MPDSPSKTFFSYAREDSEFVLRLVKDLRAAGADVWLDQLDIGPGHRWDKQVEKALEQCPSHLTVLSPAAVDSPNVMDEVSYALEENKNVIPLLYRDCLIPFRLRRVQYIDFRTEYAEGLRNLLRALGVVTQPPTAATPERVAVPATAEKTHPGLGVAAQLAKQVEPQSRKPELVEARASTAEHPRPQEHGFGPERRSVPVPTRAVGKERWLAIGGIVLLVLVILLWRMAANHGPQQPIGETKPTESPTPAVVDKDQPKEPAEPSQQHAEDSGGGAAPGSKGQTTKTLPSSLRDSKSFFRRGTDYIDKQQYDQAIDAFTQAIRLDPKYADAYKDRGGTYYRKGEHDRAIQDYSQALKLSPNDAEVYNKRGLAYYHKGEYDRAVQDYAQVLRLNPNDPAAYNNRGLAYNSKKEYDRAIQDFGQALKLNPNYANTYINRGLAYDGKRDYDRAIQDYNQALKINPNYAYAYNNRGLAYDGKKEYDRAIQDYNQALKLNPNYANAYNNRGLAYEQKGRYPQAIQDFDSALKADPNVANAQKHRDRVAAKLQK
jgi:tetratricopeptide (TPR) repeat protein